MDYTTNYNLKKPVGNETVGPGAFNDNADIIDTQLKANADAVAAKIPNSLATAVSQFLVSTAAGAWAVKTVAEIKTLLGLGSAAYTASSAYAASVHKSRHASGGADALAPSDIGAAQAYMYGTSSTEAATVAKVVTLANFSLVAGAVIGVSFNNVNAAASATLDVNFTGAIAVYCNGSPVTASQMPKVGYFQYDGSYYQLLNPIASQKMELLLKITTVAAAASVNLDLSGIDMTQYSQLCLGFTAKTSASGYFYLTLNGITTGYFSANFNSNTGTSGGPGDAYFSFPSVTSFSRGKLDILYSSPNSVGETVNMILNYGYAAANSARTSVNKTSMLEVSSLPNGITSITFTASTGNIAIGSEFYIYGVRK